MHIHTCARAHTYVRAGTHKHARAHTLAYKYTHTHTHTHTHGGKGKRNFSVAGEGVTKRAESGPFGTFCHHVVTKRARVTKRAGSNKTCFVTLVTKRVVVTKRATTGCMCLAIACHLIFGRTTGIFYVLLRYLRGGRDTEIRLSTERWPWKKNLLPLSLPAPRPPPPPPPAQSPPHAPWREAGDAWCLSPVWNLVILFLFPISFCSSA